MIIDLKDPAAHVAPETGGTLGRPVVALFRAKVTFAVGAILDEPGSIGIRSGPATRRPKDVRFELLVRRENEQVKKSHEIARVSPLVCHVQVDVYALDHDEVLVLNSDL
jgi:hypothetical protein